MCLAASRKYKELNGVNLLVAYSVVRICGNGYASAFEVSSVEYSAQQFYEACQFTGSYSGTLIPGTNLFLRVHLPPEPGRGTVTRRPASKKRYRGGFHLCLRLNEAKKLLAALQREYADEYAIVRVIGEGILASGPVDLCFTPFKNRLRVKTVVVARRAIMERIEA